MCQQRVTTNENEVSLKIDMVSQLNQYLSSPVCATWPVKKVGAELSINIDHKQMKFPDIVLYGDIYSSPTAILQMWEIKCPDVLITNSDFINDAQNKASQLGLNSTLIWNFQFCKLYVKRDGVFHLEQSWELRPEEFIRNRSDALSFIRLYRAEWMQLLNDIFSQINRYLDKGVIMPRVFDFEDAGMYVSTLIASNTNSVAERLQGEALRNILIESRLNTWWRTAQKDFESDLNDKYLAYAKCIILNWANRILFANAIKHIHFAAAAVEKIHDKITPQEANDIFAEITRQCDFFGVFASTDCNEFLDSNTWGRLCAFNQFIVKYGVPTIAHHSLQKILEDTVASAHREIIGQYTTPPRFADLLARLTVLDAMGECIDPCCGTGTISKAVIDYKVERGAPIPKAYATTWSSDCNFFPLQVATIALTSAESINIPLPVFRDNVFDLVEGKNIRITDPVDGSQIDLSLPQFDYILSNLPFIDFNTSHELYQNSFNSITKLVKDSTGVSLSGRNDMYSYILFYLWSLLKEHGRVGVIISNSWMKAIYTGFFNALRWFYHVNLIAISSSERVFKNAKVVAMLLVLEKKTTPSFSEDETMVLATIDKKLCDISVEDANLIRESFFCDSSCPFFMKHTYSNKEIDFFLNSGLSLNALFSSVEWVKDYLPKTCKVNTLFEMGRGLKSCYDDALYVADEDTVDRVFLRPMLKTGKSIKGLITEPDSYVIVCDKDVKTLRAQGYTKTADWFDVWEPGLIHHKSARQQADNNRRNGLPWYYRNVDSLYADFTIPLNSNLRIYCSRFEEPTIVNQRVTALKANPDTEPDICHALLNSMLFMFSMESGGTPMGDGALDNNGEIVKNLPMPDPSLLSPAQKAEIIEKFQPLLHRDVLNVEDELSKEDRRDFDYAVLKAYGLERHYACIIYSLRSLLKIRFCVKK